MNHDFNFVPEPTPIKVDPQYSRHGRFIIQLPTHDDESHWIKDDNVFHLICSGGFWSNIKRPSLTYNVEIGIKPIDTDMRNVDMWKSQLRSQDPRNILEPPEGSLFGDGPEFNAQKKLFWNPMIGTFVDCHRTDMIELLTGQRQFFLRRFYSSLEPVAMMHRAQHQIVISPPSPVHSIVNELKTKNQAQIHRTMVTKQEFDKFWTILFASHGNSQPAATRASLESYVRRPEFKSSPNWQVWICFLIMGDPVIRNASTSTMVRQ